MFYAEMRNAVHKKRAVDLLQKLFNDREGSSTQTQCLSKSASRLKKHSTTSKFFTQVMVVSTYSKIDTEIQKKYSTRKQYILNSTAFDIVEVQSRFD